MLKTGHKAVMRFLKPALVWPLICGLLLATVILQQFPNLAGYKAVNLPESSAVISRVQGVASYAAAVQAAAPAVVNIYTTKLVRQPINPFFNDPFFQHFFSQNLLPQRERLESSLGSGVLVSADGYLLTNHHVVKDAQEIRVALQDGREVLAQILGSDPDSDLALLKIDLPNLPAIQLAASDKLAVGDVVLAIGNPFGVGQTVTQGIISALERDSLGINTYENFIQTDAAINPGNSGGALVNAYGELIGINTAIFSRSGGSQGIGFAIPSNLAQKVMLDLINEGQVIRGWIGIEVQQLTQGLAESLGLQSMRGFLVAGMLRNGPAAKAGILPGDVVTHIDKQPVMSAHTGLSQLANLKPGTKVELNLVRKGQSLKVKVLIGQRPAH